MTRPPYDANKGWIKLHRQLLDNPIWVCSTIEQRVILITILLLANHAEKQWEWKGKKFACQPGQLITSLPSLAKTTGCSIQNIRTALKKFINYEFLTDQSTGTGRLITITNWEKYQSRPDELTGEATDAQQTPNRRLTPNNNIKNEKNERNTYSPDFEKWYSVYPRSEAKAESFKNFEKVRKIKGLDFINQCTQNYIDHRNSVPENERGPAYSSRNFFGQKAYYEDFISPKQVKRGEHKNGSAVPLGSEVEEWN